MSLYLENIVKEPFLELVANQIVEGFISGLNKSPYHGFSVEFAEHRLYNNGEATKDIDWKLFARTDKLFVKKYEQETNLRCLMVIDNSSSMLFPLDRNTDIEKPNKISFAIYCCATLLQLLFKQRDAFGLSLINNKIDYITDIKSSLIHRKYIFSLLENLLTDKEKLITTKLSPFLHQLSEQIHKRSLVILFTDLLSTQDKEEEIISSFQHLRHNKHEVIVFHLNHHKTEIDFDYTKPYRFVDIETSQEIKLNPNEYRNEYQKVVVRRLERFRNEFNNMQIGFVDCDIDRKYEQILNAFLIKRKKMF